MSNLLISDQECTLLARRIRQHYGYQFDGYSRSFFRKRLTLFLNESSDTCVEALTDRLLENRRLFETFISCVTNNTTSLFRDPHSFLAIRHMVIPLLKRLPYATIWHAGCSTGEEVVSMAILLEEEGLGDRVRLLGTDINSATLLEARNGTFSSRVLEEGAKTYLAAGGKSDLHHYFTPIKDGTQQLHPAIASRLSYCHHDLSSDGPVGEVHMVFCRNVLIYFSPEVVSNIFRTLIHCLEPPRILCFGKHEVVQSHCREHGFEALSTEERIYIG